MATSVVRDRVLCILDVTTAGLQGPLMGSDEKEIVLLTYCMINVRENTVIGVQQYPLQPSTVVGQILSSQVLSQTVLTDDQIRAASRSLQSAIMEFEYYCNSIHVDPRSPEFRFITDGQLHLRQCLHPEACKKNIDLPSYYCSFFDLRKEFAKFSKKTQIPKNVAEMVRCVKLPPERNYQFLKKYIQDIINVVQCLIMYGYTFDVPEHISLVLEPGLYWKKQ